MLTKRLLTISLLLPLVAVSSTAYAGSTISDKSYWPTETRRDAQNTTASSRRGLNSAFAYDQAALRLQAATKPNEAGSAWHYQGGPKSH